MQLIFGATRFLANSVAVDVRQRAEMNDFGIPYLYRISIACQGRLQVASQADAVAQELALIAALRQRHQRLAFLRDDGGATSIDFSDNNTLGGVVIADGTNLPQAPGAYATVRDFSFTAECAVPVVNASTAIVSWTDKMKYNGGGPRYAYFPSSNGPSQLQRVWPSEANRIVHSGTAVGFRAYPTVLPVFRTMQSPDYERGSPKSNRGALYNYPLSWSFLYESVGPLNLLPIVYNPA